VHVVALVLFCLALCLIGLLPPDRLSFFVCFRACLFHIGVNGHFPFSFSPCLLPLFSRGEDRASTSPEAPPRPGERSVKHGLAGK